MSDEPAGWQAHPTSTHEHRCWDGTRWTDYVASAGISSTQAYEPMAADAAVPLRSGGLFSSPASQRIDVPAGADEPVAPDAPDAAPDEPAAEAHGPSSAAEPFDRTAVFSDDPPATADDPAVWPDRDVDGGAPAAPPPAHVPEGAGGAPGRLGSNFRELGEGGKGRLLVGVGVLVAVLLLVVAMSVLGGDDDSAATPIGTSGSRDATATTGTSAPPNDGEYGSNPFFDALHDACEDGDFASCDQLYLDSEDGSGYQTFGDTCGDRNEPGGYCVKLYADAGIDAAASPDDTLPDEQMMTDTYAALGLEPDQAACLAGRFRAAVESGSLEAGEALTGVGGFLSDCDISLDDISGD